MIALAFFLLDQSYKSDPHNNYVTYTIRVPVIHFTHSVQLTSYRLKEALKKSYLLWLENQHDKCYCKQNGAKNI